MPTILSPSFAKNSVAAGEAIMASSSAAVIGRPEDVSWDSSDVTARNKSGTTALRFQF
jgi:hypothetical protein